MNVTVSLLASALIPAGLVKDVTAIICVTGLLGETVVAQQHMSFFVRLSLLRLSVCCLRVRWTFVYLFVFCSNSQMFWVAPNMGGSTGCSLAWSA